MNTDNWNYYYKIDPAEKRFVRSNMLYTPLVNSEGNVFCMDWNPLSDYHLKHNEQRDLEKSIDFFFPRELEYILKFCDKPWAPELIDVDEKNKKIFFKWYGKTCNNIIYSNKDLTSVCPTWKTQLKNIIKEIFDYGYYKMAMYPHCFYVDDQGNLRTFDFYSCTPKHSKINFDQIKDMVGPNSKGRFDEAINVDNMIDVDILFKRALEKYIVWPENVLQDLYTEIFIDD